jgi:hypothetical protein
MTQHDAVILAMENAGGVATLGQLYLQAMKIPGCQWGTKTPLNSIRRIVQTRKEIYKIKPGLYGLVAKKAAIEAQGIFEEGRVSAREAQVADHSYYQGLLLYVGKAEAFETFSPQQDKRRTFLGTELRAIRTLESPPPFSFPNIVRRSETVDVTWFNKRRMPHAFFEVELSTDFQNSLLKFTDLQDFHADMVIVSDACRKREYEAKLQHSAFDPVRERVQFRPFDSVVKHYEYAMVRTSRQALSSQPF